jgi:hypothetical protein
MGYFEFSIQAVFMTVTTRRLLETLVPNIFSLELLRRVNVPTIVYSASLLLTNKIFICGGEDFKLYKYNYETGTEIGKIYQLFFFRFSVFSTLHFLLANGLN